MKTARLGGNAYVISTARPEVNPLLAQSAGDIRDLISMRDAKVTSTATVLEQMGMLTLSDIEQAIASIDKRHPSMKDVVDAALPKGARVAPTSILEQYSQEDIEAAADEAARRFPDNQTGRELLTDIRRGLIPADVLADHLPRPGGAGDTRERTMSLPVGEHTMLFRCDAKRERDTMLPIIKAWVFRWLDRNGHSMVTSTAMLNSKREHSTTLLDTPREVVYVTFRYVEFGQTYGLAREVMVADLNQKTVNMPVPDGMKEVPIAP